MATIVARGEPIGPMRLKTLLAIRWLAVGGQLFTVLIVQWSLDIDLALFWILPTILASALLNLAFQRGSNKGVRLTERSALSFILFDIAQLTILLAFTGGLKNPFAALLVLPVMLAAATLSFTAAAIALASACVALSALLAMPASLPWLDGVLEFPTLYLVGSWIALTLTAILVGAYAWKLAEESRRMSAALAATQEALAREQELSAIGGIAAAAAHELGSPLAAISVAAKEIWRDTPKDSHVREEAEIVLAQSQRCREILQSLSRRGPEEDDHTPFLRAPVQRLMSDLATETALPGVDFTMRVEVRDQVEPPRLVMPITVRHGLLNLLENAFEFAQSSVDCAAIWRRGELTLVIDDDGPGFSPEAMDSLGEPYRSTRPESGGLGLGVFIAVTLLARSGGAVHFRNNQKGARVEVVWRSSELDRLWTETLE